MRNEMDDHYMAANVLNHGILRKASYGIAYGKELEFSGVLRSD